MKRFRKRMIANTLALSLILSVPTQYAFAAEKNSIQFSDIGGHWGESLIKEFVKQGYINGYEDQTFKPNNNITRAEFISIVNSAFGFTKKGTENFTDVNSGDWFYEDVLKAVNQGYIDGYEDNTFRPNKYITREEACKILGSILNVSGSRKISFKDDMSISIWAKNYVDILSDKGVIKGYEDNTFRPKNNTTRAESVAFIHRSKESTTDVPVVNPDLDNSILNPENPKWNLDTDKDGLSDAEEEILGINPNKVDSDDDGLKDEFELEVGLDPNNKDSDKNGILDSDEDLDNDGLKNIDEQKYNTSPIFEDTDGDMLSDNEEINKYKTNPNEVDSDNDGINDGKEIELGTNPNEVDSDNDGVNDGDEKYNISLDEINSTDSPISVIINADSKGKSIENITATNVSSHEFITSNIPGYIGAPIELNYDSDISNIEAEFKYNLSKLSDIENFVPEVFYYNQDTNSLEKVESSKAKSNNSVKVSISKKGIYILLNGKEWEEAWNTEILAPIKEAEGEGVNLDIALAIDSSGSMGWNDPKNLRITTSQKFIEQLRDGDRGAVIDFDATAKVLQTLTNDKALLKSKLSLIDSNGGTDIYEAIGRGIELYNAKVKTSKNIVLLTDGIHEHQDKIYDASVIQQAKDNNIRIHTIGLSNSVDEKFLKDISDKTGGKYLFAESASDLEDVFEEVENVTIGLSKDSDNDGIPDYFEDQLRLSNGVIIKLDPNNPDTDGDGLLDGQEIFGPDKGSAYEIKNMDPEKRLKLFNDAYNKENNSFIYYSDPSEADIDKDGFNDKEEYENNFKPNEFTFTDTLLLKAANLSYSSGLDKYIGKELKNIDGLTDKLQLENNKVNLTGFKNLKLLNYNDGNELFGAMALVKDKDLIITYTGSQPLFDGDTHVIDAIADWLITDGIAGITGHNLQSPSAAKFINNTINLVKEKNIDIDNVYITGHSLGGNLAQDMVYEWENSNTFITSNSKSDTNGKYNMKSRVFNPLMYTHPDQPGILSGGCMLNDSFSLGIVPPTLVELLLDLAMTGKLTYEKHILWNSWKGSKYNDVAKTYYIPGDFINSKIGGKTLGTIREMTNPKSPSSVGFQEHSLSNFYYNINYKELIKEIK